MTAKLTTWLLIFGVGVALHRTETREAKKKLLTTTKDDSNGMAIFLKATAEICQVKPPEKHCQIEWAVRDRWPHQQRWVYDWRRRNCNVIRWANHCPTPSPNTNNFPSEFDCLIECSGWA